MRDQEFGFFGFDATQDPPQPLHRATIDIDLALFDAGELRLMWHQSRQFPDAPPFGGGVLTDWPAIAVDGFAILNSEQQLVDAYRRHMAPKGKK